jgi:general secretion pathway protein K
MTGAGRRPARRRRQAGVVLLVVLFFALLLTTSVATFMRRSTIDSMIARNRDASARAETLARGGVRLAAALLAADALSEAGDGVQMATEADPWSLIGQQVIETEDGATLRLRIHDMGNRVNLNALPLGDGAAPPEETRLFLRALLEKVILELPLDPAEKALYLHEELADNLIDWLDPDDVRLRGGPEDAWYQEQDPPYRAANRPLLSVDELRLVEGFDGTLVDGLRPYVTVHPWSGSEGGINPNTAPPHILGLLYYFDGVTWGFVGEDEVREILSVREEGGLICEGQSAEGCTPMSSILGAGRQIFPEPSYQSRMFLVEADARVGDVRRRIETVMDRENLFPPLLLSWNVR